MAGPGNAFLSATTPHLPAMPVRDSLSIKRGPTEGNLNSARLGQRQTYSVDDHLSQRLLHSFLRRYTSVDRYFQFCAISLRG